MTIGTKTDGDINGPFYRTKTWGGDDGKYLPSGDLKWNAYNCSFLEFSRTKYKSTSPFPPDQCKDPTYTEYAFVRAQRVLSSPWSSNDTLALLGALAAKIRGHSFNMGTFLAQGNQALGQTMNTLGAIGKALIDLKSGNVAGAARALALTPGQRSVKRWRSKVDAGDISGAWLAMQYGWLPTLSDVYEAWKVFSDSANRPRVATFTARRRKSARGDCSTDPGIYRVDGVRTISMKYQYQLTEILSVPRSLGLEDPLSIVWEVIPYSFVVDWFLPVGSYLDALSVFPFVSGRWCLSSLDKQTAVGCSIVSTAQTFANSCGKKFPIYKPGSCTYVLGSFVRSIGTSSLQVPLPSFDFGGLHGKRIFNAVALLHQRLRT